MSECSECGASDDPKLFTCSYCDLQFCADHRLPESHDCASFAVLDAPLEGDGPNTADRRSTWRKQIERVREKETKKSDRRVPERQPNPDRTGLDVDDIPACAKCDRMRSDLEEIDGETICSDCRNAGDDTEGTSVDAEDAGEESDEDATAKPAQPSAFVEDDAEMTAERRHGWDDEELREPHLEEDDGRESLLLDAAVLLLLLAIVASAGLLVVL